LGCKPASFGRDGTPTIDDDDVLSDPRYPQAKVLPEYFLVEKRLGQIANGNEARDSST
jgi:DNA polymerase I